MSDKNKTIKIDDFTFEFAPSEKDKMAFTRKKIKELRDMLEIKDE
tara:strand:- start:4685 stop:4819 length:135 start_codon:yes stop_codon:yes gene_type:complete